MFLTMASARLPCCTILSRLSRSVFVSLADLGARLVVELHSVKRLPQFVDQFGRDSREIVDEIERVLDLVRDAGGELTERGKLLRLHQAILRGAQVLQRLRQLARARFHAFEQPHVLDCDCRLIRERGD